MGCHFYFIAFFLFVERVKNSGPKKVGQGMFLSEHGTDMDLVVPGSSSGTLTGMRF